MSLYSMARIRRVNVYGLELSETHARRETPKARARVVRDAAPITYVPDGVAIDPLRYADLYSDHVKGAFVPKAKSKALHLLVKFPESVPVATVEDAQAALGLAVKFARSVFGDEAVFAARMDRDEKSLTNADVFIAPCYVKKTKHTEKRAVSLTKHLKALATSYAPLPTDSNGLTEQGRALQDEFARFLRECGYQALRGQPKTTNGPDWTSPEAYAAKTDRAIADATLEVARGYYQEGTAEHDLAERDRDAVTRVLNCLSDEWGKIAEGYASLHEASADGGRRRVELLDEADTRAREVVEEAEAAAKKKVDDAQAEADRIEIAATEAVNSRLKSAQEAELRADEIARTAERKRDEALNLRAEAARAQKAALTKDQEAERQLRDLERAIIDIDQAKVAALAAADLADQQREAAGVLSHQLDLINRARDDETLALRIDDTSVRGVSMNESAMIDEERAAYHAPWSDLARSIARTIAATLVRVREAIDAANQKVETILGAAASRLSSDRSKLNDERIHLNKRREALDGEREHIMHQQDRARQFIEAWDAIPSEERMPIVREALDAARGLFAQAEQLAPATPAATPHGPRAESIGQSIKEGGRDTG